jgi:hypothetical protein
MMPTGKISPKLGGVGWVNAATLDINAFEMVHLAKKGVVPLARKVNAVDLREGVSLRR